MRQVKSELSEHTAACIKYGVLKREKATKKVTGNKPPPKQKIFHICHRHMQAMVPALFLFIT